MFEVKKHLIKIQGNRLYLPVAARLVWFRQEHPDWGIETRPIEISAEKQYAIFEAKIYNAEGRLMATGTKHEDIRGFPDYLEKAETGAIGRALAVCGFGTQFAPDLDEVSNGRIVDSPVAAGRPVYGENGAAQRPATSYPQRGDTAVASARYAAAAPRPPAPVSMPQSDPDARAQHNGEQSRPTSPRPDTGDAPEHVIESRPASAAHAASNPSAESDGAIGEHSCAGCGRGLTKGQEALSARKFGIALCPDCQKERRTADAAA